MMLSSIEKQINNFNVVHLEFRRPWKATHSTRFAWIEGFVFFFYIKNALK
jgi:hypothetical protein